MKKTWKMLLSLYDQHLEVLIYLWFWENSETNSNVFIDNGRGNNCKLLCINATTLTTGQKKAIVGLHAFTGTEHSSSYFQRSKMKCWTIAQDYLSTFSNSGKEFEMTQFSQRIRRVLMPFVRWQNLGRECFKKLNILENKKLVMIYFIYHLVDHC